MPVKAHHASDYLNTPEDVAAYLNAAIEEMGEDPRLLMKALRNVAAAQGGVSALARQAKLDRGRAVSRPIWPAPSPAGHARKSGRRVWRQAPILGVRGYRADEHTAFWLVPLAQDHHTFRCGAQRERGWFLKCRRL